MLTILLFVCVFQLPLPTERHILCLPPNPSAVNKGHNIPLPTLPHRIFSNNKHTFRNSARTCFLTIKTGRQAFAGTRPSFATISFNRLYT